jgi:hypothetical protein
MAALLSLALAEKKKQKRGEPRACEAIASYPSY